jgi:hypothetical protein
MTRRSKDDVAFRVSCVGESGAVTAKKFTSWASARRYWAACTQMSHMLYAVAVEVHPDDGAFIAVIDEWSRKGFGSPL